jgi:proteic killer suppression protein
MIVGFKDAETQKLFETGKSRKIPGAIQRAALRKLNSLHFAVSLNDLRVPLGNREGQHSIRINDQYRVCFVWKDDKAYEVEIVDYH